jgi:arabinofuranan 3-O-arabinosyltransferase
VGRWTELAGLAVLSYVPFLVSSMGRVGSDSKQYLYLDPGSFLVRAAHVWDPQVAAGTVSHQQLGYLWPMGPWYWAMDAAGVPLWVAQRLWLGSLSFAAVLGARWLLGHLGIARVGALAGAIVYLFTPYQLAFTARMSVLLLPWAGLPWLVGLADRAVRRGGWRDPAIAALVLLTVGGVNASSLVLVGVGPVVWVLLLALAGRADLRRAAAAAGRIALLGLGVSLWWIVGLRLGAAYGLDVLRVTESLETVAAASSPLDVLRGIGNWFFYGQDRLGYSIDQAAGYLDHGPTVIASFAVPVLALLAAMTLRWEHRNRAITLVLVGTVVAVGAWPNGGRSPYGRAFASFSDTAAGFALRNTPRAAPVIVLGFALVLGAAVGAVGPASRRLLAGGVVVAVACAAMWPAWDTGFLSDRVTRDDPVPGYWQEAAGALDAAGDETRVLELPGSHFAAHRWGNAIDPVLPGLTDRPQLSREVFPQGSAGSALLLDALDRRIQEGTFETESLTPVARLFGVGTVLVRSDLQYERFRSPRPRSLWATMAGADGLADPVAYGEPVPNVPVPHLPMLDEIELAVPVEVPDPPPVALFDVEDPVPIVRTAPVSEPVLIVGDGDGIVDASAAGVVDGRSLVLQVDALDDEALDAALQEEPSLILTDSNRRRAQTWFYGIRDTRGATEQAGETIPEPTGYDVRIDAFPGGGDASRTVVQQLGGTVTGSGSGGTARPEDRPVHVADGRAITSWRVGGADPTGHWVEIVPETPQRTDHLRIVQPLDGPRDRVLTEVRVQLDDDEPFPVALGPASLTADGQVIELEGGERDVRSLRVEIAGVSDPPFDPALANAVGFAEIEVGDTQVVESVRLPVEPVERAGGGDGHALDVVLSRLRYGPGERGRQDQELELHRTWSHTGERTFGLGGTIRIDPDLEDHRLDELLGTELDGAVVSTSGHLLGDLASRGSRVLDRDQQTAWQAPMGLQEGQWLGVRLPTPTRLGPLHLDLVDDGRHSVATRLRVEADGAAVSTVEIAHDPDTTARPRGATRRVELPRIPGRVSELRLVIEQVARATAVPGDPDPAATLPVAIAELAGDGLPSATEPAAVPDTCRSLLEIDGIPVQVRAVGAPADARAGLALESCDGDLRLGTGSHALRARPGHVTGAHVDRVVLSSAADGTAAPLGARGSRRSAPGAPAAVVVADGRVSFEVEVESDGSPFWLVLGQSANAGWGIDVDGGAVGPRTVVDGYANGWLIEPDAAGPVQVQLEWEPQRLVWIGLVLSLLVALLCVAIVARTRGRRTEDDAAPILLDAGPADGAPAGGRPVLALAAGVAVVALLVATPLAAIVAAAVVVTELRMPRSRPWWIVAAPSVLAAAKLLDEPALAWVALAIVGADGAVRWLVRRGASERRPVRQSPASTSNDTPGASRPTVT